MPGLDCQRRQDAGDFANAAHRAIHTPGLPDVMVHSQVPSSRQNPGPALGNEIFANHREPKLCSPHGGADHPILEQLAFQGHVVGMRIQIGKCVGNRVRELGSISLEHIVNSQNLLGQHMIAFADAGQVAQRNPMAGSTARHAAAE